ncbi:hypothetical protein A5791_22425 [Mycobacterium sp. 852002-51163_SCH5372311]|nr:helix-turn-helix domain-containing protein [Mycobacterium sp. 852002-51163_SCH5372311]OBF85574.1 hypothetical protein A5791_22425 [Mycobacterium sp. 852002-51163_SCH5372311]
MSNPSNPVPGGRPRDQAIDEAVLRAALQALARDGLTGLSMTKVAASAGTTRTAIYRRWPSKTALAVAAVARLAQADRPPVTGDPFADLVAGMCCTLAGATHFGELHDYRQKVSIWFRSIWILDPRGDLMAHAAFYYQIHVVIVQALLQAGIDGGQLPADADLAQAGASLTGSWYAYQLAGITPPEDWPLRTAAFVWRGCGGTPPPAAHSPAGAM